MSTKHIVIIGGGASGLLAALVCARNGCQVTLLEQLSKPGKKILSTGNGKCNYTNKSQKPEDYRGTDPQFAWGILNQFPVEETIRFFKELGIYPKEKNGYLYPNSSQASSVLDVLLMENQHLKVKIKTGEKVTAIQCLDKGYEVLTNHWHYTAEKVIMATGGKAAPILGSDGSGYDLVQRLGHTIIKPLPALTGLKVTESYVQKLAGIRVDGKATLKTSAGNYEERGEIQLTKYGLSGIPIFQLSTYAAIALERKEEVTVILDFLPDLLEDETYHLLNTRVENSSYKTAEQVLVGLFNEKLIEVLLQSAHIPGSTKVGDLAKEQLLELTKQIKNHKFHIKATNSFEQAQVCSGGVSTKEIDPLTLESKIKKNIYFAGELMDIDGTCGGYNLQWAWSSGYVSATHASKG